MHKSSFFFFAGDVAFDQMQIMNSECLDGLFNECSGKMCFSDLVHMSNTERVVATFHARRDERNRASRRARHRRISLQEPSRSTRRLISTLAAEHMERKIVYQVFFSRKEKRNRAFAKNRRKKTSTKTKKTATARTCMYDL